MAVVATVTAAVPLPERLSGTSTQPNNNRGFLVKVVIQSADYSSGFSLATIATACGGSAVTAALVDNAKIAAGTVLFGFGVHDVTNNKVRFFTAITNQTTATDYTPANGDIFTLFVTVQ